jgi:hypothetical protein
MIIFQKNKIFYKYYKQNKKCLITVVKHLEKRLEDIREKLGRVHIAIGNVEVMEVKVELGQHYRD